MSNYNSNLLNKSYFRSIIPKDLQKDFGGKDEFRLSLRYVINGDTKILCLKLKEITDKLFTEIRKGMKSVSGRHKRNLTNRSQKTNQAHPTLLFRNKCV